MTDDPRGNEDLAALAELPPDDPRRVAFERTPHGRALLAAYRSFAAGDESAPGARPDEAETALTALLHETISGGPGAAGGAASAAAPVRVLRPARWSGWASGLAAAAALAVVAGLWLARDAERPQPARQRGAVADSTAAAFVGHAVRLPDGVVELQWERRAGADGYEVEFFDAGLAFVARSRRLDGVRMRLAGADLPAGTLPGAPLAWCVVALRGSDTLAVTPTAIVRLP
jgi:hypothetical protein